MKINDIGKEPLSGISVSCQYCQGAARLVKGATVYPGRGDLSDLDFWHCAPCQAWVGCHPGTENPLGILAKKDLRRLKQRVHALFDPLWVKKWHVDRPFTSRPEAYRWLREQLRIDAGHCHIGMFDNERCLQALELLVARWTQLGWALPAGEKRAQSST